MSLRTQLKVAALIALAAITAIIVPTSCYYSRIEPQSLRSELIAAGIMGSDAEAAATKLRRLELPRGSALLVGEYNATTKLLYASVSNAQRRGWHVWRARVTLSFNGSDRV